LTKDPPVEAHLGFGSVVVEDAQHERDAEASGNELSAFQQLYGVTLLVETRLAVLRENEDPSVFEPVEVGVVPEAADEQENRALDAPLVTDDAKERALLGIDSAHDLLKNHAI